MPGDADGRAPIDRGRLERILAPWTAAARGPAVWIEDPAGMLVAGRGHPAGGTGQGRPVEADVVVEGELVLRVVATGEAPDAVPRAAMNALALAIGELILEARGRDASQRALDTHRSEHVATSLGIDTAELAKGRRQQRSILSLDAPDVPGYELASHYAAAREIGGDFFELFRLPRRGRPLGIVIADVTGKGLDAALLMAFARPVMHSALNAARGPADAIERTNRVLVEERRGTLFITLLCAVLQPASGRLRIASAGHEPPLLIPGDGGPIAAVGDVGVMMGAFTSIGPPETELTLAPGDTLLLYTDGVTDAVAPTGERFGDGRLTATLDAARGGSAQAVVAAVRDRVRAFAATSDPVDDLTLVAVQRRRRAVRSAGHGGAAVVGEATAAQGDAGSGL